VRVLTGEGPPLVSVVMAVHNGAELIDETIASVLAQSHEALELLIVDDGSTDATVEAVRQSARGDGRVKLLERGHAGQPMALNEGIAEAGGSYIARVDHDDLWHRDHLSAQLARIANGGVDVCGSWVRKIGDASGVLRFPSGHEAIRYEALFACPILDSATLYRAEVLREHPYPPSAIVRTGMVQLLRLLPFYRFANLPRILTEYRFHAMQKTKRLASLAIYRQRQLQEQHFAQLVPDADSEEHAAFALAIGTGPLACEELLRIADLFIRRLRSADPEARERMVCHWRRMVARKAEAGTAQALRHRLDEAFLA
jgi:glycosyltransferase involved in cell wall biosynthesis